MNEEQYIEKRLDDQIDWYSRKSTSYKNRFHFCCVAEITAAAILTIIACVPDFKIVLSMLSAFIVILAGITALFKFQELWISYRTTSESLKHEKYLYETKTDPYQNEGRFNLLVKNIERMISSENSSWQSTSLKGK